ncbi:MAG: AAA family ATPase [Desulfovibrionaceae bacterium]|nr:AAA family ATPase [Desulfovibrionaceae bacterium]
MDIPPRGHVLYPVIPTQGLAMLHAMRGIGKTFAALQMAYAVASGGTAFTRWRAEKPLKVLYIDGEMPMSSMQERLARITQAAGTEPPEDFFRIITPDIQPDFIMPNLATREGQALVAPYVEDADFIVVDNLATLMRTGKSNDEDTWAPVQEWILSLRRRGKSALLVHHESKNGSQRGTIAKEDALDTVIRLSRPADYEAAQGARFKVQLLKARGVFGNEAEPFEAALAPDGSWQVTGIDEAEEEQLRELAASGLSVRDIAEEMDISKSSVSRRCKKYGIKLKGGLR